MTGAASRTDGAERLARAAWSRVAEPADEVAGLLVQSVGAETSMRWLRTVTSDVGLVRRDVDRLADRIGIDDARSRARVVRAVARWQPRAAVLDPERDMRSLRRLGGRLVVPGDPEWPQGVDVLGRTVPHCLWVRGRPPLDVALHSAVALVGARASTGYGERVAVELAGGLADLGRATVSGGAYGIDAAVHRGTLAADGVTVAVLAGGVDRLYPAGNTDLLQAVLSADGLIVSEMPPGAVPSRSRFLRRNRLIAAAGRATVVVEAAWRSGSLATAGLAVDLGRPVGAVPGPVTSAASAGCHRLLRDGRAVCVTDAPEVHELAGAVGEGDSALADRDRLRDDSARRALDGLGPASAEVLDAVPRSRPARVEAVARTAGTTDAEALAALGLLELDGLVRRESGGWVRPGQV